MVMVEGFQVQSWTHPSLAFPLLLWLGSWLFSDLLLFLLWFRCDVKWPSLFSESWSSQGLKDGWEAGNSVVVVEKVRELLSEFRVEDGGSRVSGSGDQGKISNGNAVSNNELAVGEMVFEDLELLLEKFKAFSEGFLIAWLGTADGTVGGVELWDEFSRQPVEPLVNFALFESVLSVELLVWVSTGEGSHDGVTLVDDAV
jgi:hypothetical protein